MTLTKTPLTPPRDFGLGDFHFSVLGPHCAEEDFAAVTSSESYLAGLFGSEWPVGITWDKNYSDLVRHAQEFDSEFAFAWVVRNESGVYLGCFYICPKDEMRGSGEAYLWFRKSETSPERIDTAVSLIKNWMAGIGFAPERFPIITPA